MKMGKDYDNFFLLSGKDAKNLKEFKKYIDVVCVNGNVAIHNKNAITNNVINYNLKLIIDPMTYILQAELKHLMNNGELKPSILNVLKSFFGFDVSENFDANETLFEKMNVEHNLQNLIANVYKFQKDFFLDLQKNNEFGDFLEEQQVLYFSAPYFDTKNDKFLNLNKKILTSEYEFELFRIIFTNQTNMNLIDELIQTINANQKLQVVEVWIDATVRDIKKIFTLLEELNKEITFKFINFSKIVDVYDNPRLKEKVIGFITAFGYGESRSVYPVGGGIPVNKVYSTFSRERVFDSDFFNEIVKKNIDFENNPEDYLKNVCGCKLCEELVREGKGSGKLLYLFSDSTDYKRKLKNGLTSNRTKPTQEAIVLTTLHYVWNKIYEYNDFFNNNISANNKWYKDFLLNKK